VKDRFHVRVPISLEVEYRTAGSFLVAYSSNLSKGGIFLESERPADCGTELTLRFTIPRYGTIEVRGIVVWVRPAALDGRPAGMGIEFEEVDARYGSMIDEIVADFDGLRVVVLARSRDVRLLLGRAVRSVLANAEVIDAADADAAERALSYDPDLIILDLDDAGADGLLTLRMAKTSLGQPLPVIAASREDQARERARELGADEVLVSPLSLHDLTGAIVRAMGRPLRVGS